MSSREETEGKKERINCTEPKMNEVKREKEEGMGVVGKKKKKNDVESEKMKNGENHGKSDVDNTISRIGEIGKNSSPSDCKKENVQPTGSSCDAHNKTETSKVKENGVVVKEGESKEVQLQISESGVMSVSQVEDGKIVRTLEDAPPKVINNQHLITGLSLGLNKGNDNGGETNGNKVDGNNIDRTPMATASVAATTTAAAAVTPASVATATSTSTAVTESHRKTSTKPVKSYKTIRCAPKTWNPVIPKEKLRPTLMKNSPEEPKKPLKFFKMRNMPRFLGNPSSGVKPLFAHEPQENNNGGEDKKKGQDNKKQQQQQPAETVKNKILKIDPKTLRPIEKSTSEDVKVTPTTPTVPNLLTNPFIPNNNHFLFSDLHLLPPNCGNFTNSKFDVKNNDFAPDKSPPTGGIFKNPLPNGSYPPICFPTPDHKSNFYPFSNLTKPQNFPFPVTDKMDPLLRASRLSPFGNLAGFNVAGFHASLPPSISRLLNPHHHFRKINQSLENNNNNNSSSSSSGSGSSSGGSSSNSRKNKDESTKVETKNNATNCDDSLKIITNATAATSGNENVSTMKNEENKMSNTVVENSSKGETEKEKETKKEVEVKVREEEGKKDEGSNNNNNNDGDKNEIKEKENGKETNDKIENENSDKVVDGSEVIKRKEDKTETEMKITENDETTKEKSNDDDDDKKNCKEKCDDDKNMEKKENETVMKKNQSKTETWDVNTGESGNKTETETVEKTLENNLIKGNEKNVSISQGGDIKINNESASIAEVKSIRDNNSHVDDKDTKR